MSHFRIWARRVARLGVVWCALALSAGTTGAAESAALIASPEKGWPQFRGPRRDGISDERGLLQTWPGGGPKLLWSASGAGKGFSSTILADGRLFVTGDFNADTFVLAYDLQGKLLWRTQNGAAWLNQYQGARASVTFSGGRLYHQNAHGRVACLDAATGREVWAVNVLERFRSENITWGISECLLVDDKAVYVSPGGSETLTVALDKKTGDVLWRTKPLRDEKKDTLDGPGYAAPIMILFGGRRLIVGCSAQHLFAVDADSGEIHWTQPRPTTYGVLAMSPTLVGDGVFFTAPIGPPGALYRLVAPAGADGKIDVREVWTTKLDTAQGGVVHVNGRLFGTYYPRRGGWAALDAATGKVLYEQLEWAKGAPLHADGRLYALCEDGWLLLVEPTATQFELHGRFRFANARDRDAWAHPVIQEGRLYLRYHDTVTCYDIRDPVRKE